ncbi:Vegetative incompatibility protein HET-E-1 [Penicillium lividum]|nr:Vegetative incompatibility protein HET-E-1 [Penicillium lividum]
MATSLHISVGGGKQENTNNRIWLISVIASAQSETSLNQACLRDLRTTNPYDDKDRIEKTNGGLLKDSYCWIFDNEEFNQWQDNQSSRLLWIRGDPGKGKTMLLCGIIDEMTRCIDGNTDLSFFFCQATDVRINNATAVLRGLIYSLVQKQPTLLSHVRSRYDQAGKTLFEDINAWNVLSKIFADILRDPVLQHVYLVIDALDECITGLHFLLDLIVQESSTHSHTKWVVTSRNWPDIKEHLDTATQIAVISLELNEASVSDAVRKFIQHKVDQLKKVKKYEDEVRDVVCGHLLGNSQGTFLWVALVCQDLSRTSRRHVLKKLKELPPGLDALYCRMIDQVRKSEDAELCKRILAVMSIVYQPIALLELAALIGTPDDLSDDQQDLLEIIATCGSFLTLHENVIAFVHQSAKDFLLEMTHDELFPKDREAEHYAIFSRSLQSLFKTLRRNIFDMKFAGVVIEEVTQPSPDPLAAVRYACLYWVDHLQAGWCDGDEKHSPHNGEYLGSFLRQKYLHWLEALSILRSLSHGITAMLKLEELLQEKGEHRALLDQIHDASRFIRYYRQGIECCPLQVYNAALIFSPTQSLTRTNYQIEKPGWILNSPVVDENWSSCLHILEGHGDSIWSIAWSPDGGRLASASGDKTVRIWDPATGQAESNLEGHSDSVRSIAWSPNGGRLASASFKMAVRIWDPITGQLKSTFEGQSEPISTIAWSPDGSQLASASDNKTIKILNLATGEYTSILEGHRGSVRSIAWSPDGRRLASASRDKSLRIWDPATGKCACILASDSDWVNSIVWSPDGSKLASAPIDKSARIWNPATGQCERTLEGPNSTVNSIAWSPDGSQLASGSWDKSVRIWDLATGHCTLVLKGHSDQVSAIAWSPNGRQLASASSDKTLRIWELAIGGYGSAIEGHSGSINSIAWSPGGNRLASASADKTLRIWDPATGQCASTLEGHSDFVYLIVWSVDGTQFASASGDQTIRIWDPATGKCISTLRGHSNWVTRIALSPDGNRIASTSGDKTVRIWHPATGECTCILVGDDVVNSIVWSPDGSQLAYASDDKTVKIWNPATGECTSILEGHRGSVRSIAWSPDGRRLASASQDKTLKIWDPATDQCACILAGDSDRVNSIVWSPDGSKLASASADYTVRIWNPATGECTSILEGHSGLATLIAWSPDGSRLVSASDDMTVTVWDSPTGQGTSTIDTHFSYFLQFDRTVPNLLHTKVGTINLESTNPGASSPHRLTGTYGLAHPSSSETASTVVRS